MRPSPSSNGVIYAGFVWGILTKAWSYDRPASTLVAGETCGLRRTGRNPTVVVISEVIACNALVCRKGSSAIRVMIDDAAELHGLVSHHMRAPLCESLGVGETRVYF